MQTQDLVWKKSFLVHLMASWLWILLLLLACCLRRRRTTKPCTFSSIESFGQIALRHCRFPSRFSRFRLAQTRFSFELVDSHLSVLKIDAVHFGLNNFALLSALSLHAQQSLSPSQSQPQQDNPHDSSSGAAWSSLAHRIPEGLMVWRRGKGLDPRRAHAAIKSRTASKANGNLHPKKLQHLPFLRSFWMDLEGVLKKVGKRLQNQLPQSTALVAAYSM